MRQQHKTDMFIAGLCVVVFLAILFGVTNKANSQEHHPGHAQFQTSTRSG